MIILGINAYHGDAAAAIIRDGVLIAAAEEERFNRVKHCAGFPTEAVRYCLQAAGVKIEDIDHVGISRDPSAHLHKKILFATTRAAKGVGQRGKRQGVSGKSDEAEVGVGGGRSLGALGDQRSEIGDLRSDDDSSLVAHLSYSAKQQSAISNQQSHDSSLITHHSSLIDDGDGRGPGILRQVKDRFANAAKVRDLKEALARALGVPKKKLKAQFHNVEHHRAHLASSFYVSPFERAALLSIDGFGDFISTMWAKGVGNSIEVLGQVEYPHSTGIVYTATTQFLGFPHYGDEGKVMGLAPYGKPRFIEEFRDIIRTEERGQFRLNLDYFRHHAEGVDMTWDNGSPVIGRIFSNEYARLFGPPRASGAALTEREEDIAASLQLRLEEVGFHILNHLHEQTGLTDLGLSGGVAYNSVMNGKILLNTPFRRIFVQPAAGDSGTAIGVCYQIWNQIHNQFRVSGFEFRVKTGGHRDTETQSPPGGKKNEFASESQELETRNLKRETRNAKRETRNFELETRYVMEGAYTGPEFTDAEIRAELKISDLKFESYADSELTQRAAQDIADGLVVGWFQGRMEFGPRALGNRSIVVDPRRAEMKQILNDRIKKREPFRPFAPSILEEHVGDYFEQTHPAPTMLMVYQIKPERRAEIPAVTHVDGSGRLQTVTRAVNARYYQLIEDFYKLTGVPVVLNTSFNENEPIVCTPRHAIDCFLKTKMDVLYLGNHAIRRE
jgi:carbamoyltransferase